MVRVFLHSTPTIIIIRKTQLCLRFRKWPLDCGYHHKKNPRTTHPSPPSTSDGLMGFSALAQYSSHMQRHTHTHTHNAYNNLKWKATIKNIVRVVGPYTKHTHSHTICNKNVLNRTVTIRL